MRSIRLSIELPEELKHPMHRFVERSDAIDRERLLYTNLFDDERIQFLFHVEGDPETYAVGLDEAPRISSYEIVPHDVDSFYVLVQEPWPAEADVVVSLLKTATVVPIPPVEFTSAGEVGVTLVGTRDGIQTVLDRIPEAVAVEIEQLAPYEEPVTFVSTSLTARQREAVAVAVEVGYYAVPREGSVAEVADDLGCAPSTASNHLRKAEATIMSQVV